MDPQALAILVLLGSFFVMIFLRFPIAYAVALSTVLCLGVQGLSFNTLCQQMVKGISSFSLMAVPFFITMGVLMGSGGISEKLIALANACVGWMRGGMAMVNIVASYFFGGISGSASADTASIGSIMIPMMVDQGYDADFSTAVTITSSCEGLLVPPSHNMVIYATTAGGISVGSLFLAGYLPGALLDLDERTLQLLKRQANLAATLPGVKSLQLVGRWLWLEFTGKPTEEIRQQLKDNRWSWAPKKGKWTYHNPEEPRPGKHRFMTFEEIESKHGSAAII